jgi:GT2 family glycosyltransferase
LKYIVYVKYTNKISIKNFLINYYRLRKFAYLVNELAYSSVTPLKVIIKVLNKTTKFKTSKLSDLPVFYILSRNDALLIIDMDLLKINEFNERGVVYGDSVVQTNRDYWYEARPRLSLVHFSNQDYIGDVVLGNLRIESFEKVRESAIDGSLSLFNVDYAISKRYAKSVNQFNVPILYDIDTKFLKSSNIINHKPSVSVIIPTDFSNSKDYNLEKSIFSLINISANINLEVVLISHKSRNEQCNQIINKFKNTISIKAIEYVESFNFSKVVNLGVEASKHEIIFLMNDDIIFDDGSDLFHLVSHLEFEKNVGSVGIRLFDKSGTILHAGLEYRNGEPQHFLKGSKKDFLKSAHEFCREVSGCTGAFLAITKSNFYKVAKMDEAFPLDYNDVDLMLKIERFGLKNLICSKVFAAHAESLTRGITDLNVLKGDLNRLISIHGKLPDRDPYLYTPADRILK